VTELTEEDAMHAMITQAMAGERARDMRTRAALARQARETRRARRAAGARGVGILSRRRPVGHVRRSSAAAANS
jgi:hypothetical protein